jgi:diguanylate cyclase (GGDEF)-like protein
MGAHVQSHLDVPRNPLRLVVDEDPVASVAASVGADDLLVLRRVAPDRFLQIGGAGRGVGWAGCMELRLTEAPALVAAVDADRTTRWDGSEPGPVLGPYHARHAALVPVDRNTAVLFGAELPLADDHVLAAAARTAVGVVGAVSPAKRLADELELLTAVRDVMHCQPADVRAALTHVASAAAAALGCEIAVGWLLDESQLVVVEQGWSLDAGDEALVAALRQLREVELPHCRQDSRSAPLPAPLGPEHGVRSHYVLPLGAPVVGLLVLLHTAAAPRGFTDRCRTIGEKVAEAGGVVVQSSVLREELHRLVRHAEALARRDPLTGLSNRLGWDEAVLAAAEHVAAGGPASVVIVDLNGLKAVNDEQGHEAGDRLLQRAADALGSVARRGDTVARLGGDEFGLLLPDVDVASAQAVAKRVREAISTAAPVGDVPLSAAVGTATCEPGGSLRSAVYRADAVMYADKLGVRTLD